MEDITLKKIKFKRGENDPRNVKIVKMHPKKFLDLAIKIPDYRQSSLKYLSKQDTMYMPRLVVDIDTGRVISHEGRHRCFLLNKKGYKQVPVEIYYKKSYMGKFLGSEMKLHGKISDFGVDIKKVKLGLRDYKPEKRGFI